MRWSRSSSARLTSSASKRTGMCCGQYQSKAFNLDRHLAQRSPFAHDLLGFAHGGGEGDVGEGVAHVGLHPGRAARTQPGFGSEGLLDQISDACGVLLQREVAAVEQLHAHFFQVAAEGLGTRNTEERVAAPPGHEGLGLVGSEVGLPGVLL